MISVNLSKLSVSVSLRQICEFFSTNLCLHQQLMSYNHEYEGTLLSFALLFSVLILCLIYYLITNFTKKNDLDVKVKAFTLVCVFAYLLLFLTLSVKRGITFFTKNDPAYETENAKRFYYAMTILMYFLAKISLYTLFVYRLHSAFLGTSLRLPKWIMYFYGILLSTEALLAITQVIIWVQVRTGSDDKSASRILSFLSGAVVIIESCISVSVASLFARKLMELVLSTVYNFNYM